MELTSKNVHETVLDCLYNEGEDNTGYKLVEGVIQKFGFNPIKLKEHEEEIISMLEQLPNPFQKEMGGGWSFLNACVNKNEELWTSEHRTMDSLISLGIGIDKVEFLLPRETWSTLPGGMPYFVVKK